MKHIVYKYSGVVRSDDVAFDAHGEMNFAKGDVVSRHGTAWKIEAVDEEKVLGGLIQIPTCWVYLSRVLMD
jgi:hypothetical protein